MSVVGNVLLALKNCSFFNFKSRNRASPFFASLELISYVGRSCLYNLLLHIELARIFAQLLLKRKIGLEKYWWYLFWSIQIWILILFLKGRVRSTSQSFKCFLVAFLKSHNKMTIKLLKKFLSLQPLYRCFFYTLSQIEYTGIDMRQSVYKLFLIGAGEIEEKLIGIAIFLRR